MSALAETHALSVPERSRLSELEAVVTNRIQAFVEVGLALRSIRDDRLYRATHDTFSDYLRDRWGFARTTGYGYIAAAAAAESVRTSGHVLPSMAHAELVARVPVEDQERIAAEIATVSVSEARRVVSRHRTHLRFLEQQKADESRRASQPPRPPRPLRPPPPAPEPYVADTPRKQQIARAHVKKVHFVIASINGIFAAVESGAIDLRKAAAAMTREELLDAAREADRLSQEMLDFGQELTVAAETYALEREEER